MRNFRKCISAFSLCLVHFPNSSAAQATPKLADLWTGKAHFEQVGQFNWQSTSDQHSESAGWFTVRDGIWYVFNRAYINRNVDYCPIDHARIVVRESSDQGKHWSAPIIAVEPGDSPGADDCNALDGSTYFDQRTGTWHMLSQCLAKNESSRWALCHYTRRSKSPMGKFLSDNANPVVRGGALWSHICAGTHKSCSVYTQDEGTPEILGKHKGLYIVTFHGWLPSTGQGVRGVAGTKDFRSWQTKGNDLPNDAIFTFKDCYTWLAGCVGIGATSTYIGKSFAYIIGEVMNKSLACQKGQKWVFELFRVPRGPWPRSGAGKWQKLPGAPLLEPTWPDSDTPCQLGYARWIVDKRDLYLVYEDWGPDRKFVNRRLLKLIAGPGPRIKKTNQN